MALQKTNLVVVAAPLPADFEGQPQDLYTAMVERMEIQSPVGTNFFVTGDVEPSSNQGPWLKGGTKWYVFDLTEGGYIPLDISDSNTTLFTTGPTTPTSPPAVNDALLWLRTSGSRGLGWYAWDGLIWRAIGAVPPSGDTLTRPTAPEDLEQFWDTDINAMVHWERGAWRTVSGTPGDIKFVAHSLLADALTANPGWQYAAKDDQSLRGLVLGVASTDPGVTPVNSFPTDSGISPRESGIKIGVETHVLDTDEIPQHTHLVGHATALNSNNDVFFHRVDDGETIGIPPILPPNHFELKGDGSANGTKLGTAGTGNAGTMIITSRQITTEAYTGVAVAHENMQPTAFLWLLVKT
jgi:hypothetical protein